jgi:hypothetical protein
MPNLLVFFDLGLDNTTPVKISLVIKIHISKLPGVM